MKDEDVFKTIIMVATLVFATIIKILYEVYKLFQKGINAILARRN
jgi:hypothetical protein